MDGQLIEEIKKRIGRECRKITLTATDYTIENDETELTKSKVLGNHFFPQSMANEYPRAEEGNPLVMFAQINFAEVPPMKGIPESGLMQVYLNPFHWSDDNYIVLYIDEEQLKEESIDVYNEILQDWLQDAEYYMPTQHVHTMEFSKGMSYSAADDNEYARWLSKIEKEYSREIVKEYATIHSAEFGSRIGGYCDFTQYDPRRKSYFQLLQLDSEEGINFYDCGVMHVFITPADLKKEKFENAIVYTDYY